MHPLDLIAGGRRRLSRALARHRFGALGEGSTWDPTTSVIVGFENFYIGRNVFIGGHAWLSARGVPVRIGDDTIVGPGLYILAGDHEFGTPGVSYRRAVEGKNAGVTVGRNVWIGARVTILKGVNVGDAAVIGAGAVVTRDIPAFAVAVGNPARVARWRFEGEDRRHHEEFLDHEMSIPDVPVRSN